MPHEPRQLTYMISYLYISMTMLSVINQMFISNWMENLSTVLTKLLWNLCISTMKPLTE